jgi:hypothetical protein
VEDRNYPRVREAARALEGPAKKPVFEELNGEVPYEEIRIVVAHIEAMGTQQASKP